MTPEHIRAAHVGAAVLAARAELLTDNLRTCIYRGQ
jgi:hypothetical protein